MASPPLAAAAAAAGAGAAAGDTTAAKGPEQAVMTYSYRKDHLQLAAPFLKLNAESVAKDITRMANDLNEYYSNLGGDVCAHDPDLARDVMHKAHELLVACERNVEVCNELLAACWSANKVFVRESTSYAASVEITGLDQDVQAAMLRKRSAREMFLALGIYRASIYIQELPELNGVPALIMQGVEYLERTGTGDKHCRDLARNVFLLAEFCMTKYSEKSKADVELFKEVSVLARMSSVVLKSAYNSRDNLASFGSVVACVYTAR